MNSRPVLVALAIAALLVVIVAPAAGATNYAVDTNPYSVTRTLNRTDSRDTHELVAHAGENVMYSVNVSTIGACLRVFFVKGHNLNASPLYEVSYSQAGCLQDYRNTFPVASSDGTDFTVLVNTSFSGDVSYTISITIARPPISVWEIALLVVLAFLPPAIIVTWIRNTERYGREPWGPIIGMFLWGAIFAVIIGIILETIFILPFQVSGTVDQEIANRFGDPSIFVLILVAVVIAPFVEEFAKAYGVLRRQFILREPEDGFVYGATSGLGFSATETSMYGVLTLLVEGLPVALALVAIRSVSSTLLHASATSLTGYGIARRRIWGPRFSARGWYLGAVAMHSAFNVIAVFGAVLASQYGPAGTLIVLAGAVVFAFVAFSIVRGKIMEHDARQGWVP